MSESQDIIKLIKDQNQLMSGEYKDAIAKAGNEQKEAIEKMDQKLNDMADQQLKMEKSVKAQTVVAGMSDDEHKRKQCAEFVKGLRDIASGSLQQFKTDEFKSTIERKDYNSGDDQSGGVFVMPFLDAEIGKLIREFSAVRELASVATISTDKWEQIVMNKVNGALWEKDMADFSTGTKNNTFNKLNMMVQNLHAIAIFSDDLINDSAFDLVGTILTDVAEDLAIAEGLSYWNGNGVGEMTGVLTSPDADDSFNGIERLTSANATSIVFDDIFDLVGAPEQRYLANSQFKANRAVITGLRKLTDSENRPLWEQSQQVATPSRLAGYPISQAQELASVLATDAEALVFGDFRQGTKIIDRMGMTVLRDNLTQYPNVAYKVKKRVTGGVVKGQALKILKQA